MLDSVKYWLRDQPTQNFGDALSRVYMDRLFLPLGTAASHVHLVGSVIDDMFVEDARKQNSEAEPVFWGCGVRTELGVSDRYRDYTKILSVRGPISAKVLGIDGRVPMGDSALILPAIYTPSVRADSAQAICIPHFHETRSDEELLHLSGCDAVLRPTIGPDLFKIYDLIDRIASAKFVLSASLHGAIVAAVYGRPFCFWDNGEIDLPLKWEDFAGSIGVPCTFAERISEATEIYRDSINEKVQFPPIVPLALCAPFVIRAEAASKIAAWSPLNERIERIDSTKKEPSAASSVTLTNQAIFEAVYDIQISKKQIAQMYSELREKDETHALEVRKLQAENQNEVAQLLSDAPRRYERLRSILNSRDEARRGIVKYTKFRLRALREEKIIRQAGLFDEQWYRSSYPDLPLKKNVVRHYVSRGRFEDRNPNPFFITSWYQGEYPEVLTSGMNPLIHYLRHGAEKGYDPGPNFSTSGYYEAHPHLMQSKINPLAHFLRNRHEPDRPACPQVQRPAPPSAPQITVPATSVKRRPKAVIIDSIYPTPDRDSGSIDAVNFVNTFMQLGFDVDFVSDTQFYERSTSCTWLTDAGATLVNLDSYPSVDQFIRQEGSAVDVFFLSRVYSGARWLEHIFRHSTAKIIFNTVDLHFLREERQAKLANNRRELNLAAGTRERELAVTRLADATIVVSDAEANLLRELVPDAKVLVIPLGRPTPGANKTFYDRSDIGFIGGFAHLPNVDAVTNFINSTWPIIKVKQPAIRFHIYGSAMPDSFHQFTSIGVVPEGYVKEVAPVLERHRVMVAPLRYGAGAKGKVVTSLAHGVPCVATSVATEGMGLEPGKNILVADSPEAFAAAVCAVYSDEALWSKLSNSGFATAKEKFALQNTIDKMRALLIELGAIKNQNSASK